MSNATCDYCGKITRGLKDHLRDVHGDNEGVIYGPDFEWHSRSYLRAHAPKTFIALTQD